MPVPISAAADDLANAVNLASYELGATDAYDTPYLRLEAGTALVATAEELQAQLVADARAAGFTWEQIARALGVSKQTAHARYASRGVTQVPTSQGAASPLQVMPTDQVPKSKLSRQQRRQLDRLDRRKARR